MVTMLDPFSSYWSACPDAACTLGKDGHIRAVNRAFTDRLGNLAGQPFDEHAVTDNRGSVRAKINELLEGETSISFFAPCRSASGESFLLAWRAWRVDDADAPIIAVATNADFTSNGHMQDALLRSQQRLALHFQQSPLGMIEWDREFRVTDWNPAAERIFGWSREEAMGQYGQDLVVPEAIRPYVADVWQELLNSRSAVNAHNENVTKHGRTIVCEWSNTTLIDANGDVVGVASLINDVTDRKKEEDGLRERERAQAETIQQLSVPLIDVWDGVLALPIVGTIDEARAMRMTESLLEAIVQNSTRYAILDMTGATAMDSSIATHLGDMVRATRLVGSECLVSGLGPGLARTLAELDVPLSVKTFGSLRAALRHAIRATRQ